MPSPDNTAAALAGKAGAVKKKIKARQKRLRDLRDQLDAATAKCEAAEETLATGDGDPAEAQADAEAHARRRDTLHSAAERAERQLQTLRSRLEEIEAERKREAALTELAEQAERAAALRERHDNALRELAAEIERGAGAVVDAREAWAAACVAFRKQAEVAGDPSALAADLRKRTASAPFDLTGALSRRRHDRHFAPRVNDDGPELGAWGAKARKAVEREGNVRAGRREHERREERRERRERTRRQFAEAEAAREVETRQASLQVLQRARGALSAEEVAGRTRHALSSTRQALQTLAAEGTVERAEILGAVRYDVALEASAEAAPEEPPALLKLPG